MYNHISLIPHMLHQSTLQWICTSLTNDEASLVRTLYCTYQRIQTILKYNQLASDVANMDTNALHYILNRHQNNKAWYEQNKQTIQQSSSYTKDLQLRDNENKQEDLQKKIEHVRCALDAVGEYTKQLSIIQLSLIHI